VSSVKTRKYKVLLFNNIETCATNVSRETLYCIKVFPEKLTAETISCCQTIQIVAV